MSEYYTKYNTITKPKLISLYTLDLTPEQKYVDSIVYQAEDAGLTGATGFTIYLPPPALNPTDLLDSLIIAFADSNVTTISTAGVTGYKITWN
jgi:hypothetical protein